MSRFLTVMGRSGETWNKPVSQYADPFLWRTLNFCIWNIALFYASVAFPLPNNDSNIYTLPTGGKSVIQNEIFITLNIFCYYMYLFKNKFDSNCLNIGVAENISICHLSRGNVCLRTVIMNSPRIHSSLFKRKELTDDLLWRLFWRKQEISTPFFLNFEVPFKNRKINTLKYKYHLLFTLDFIL